MTNIDIRRRRVYYYAEASIVQKILFAYKITNRVNLSADMHTHDHHHLMYLYRGHCRASVMKREYAMAPGMLITVPPHTQHSFVFPKYAKERCVVLHLKCHLSDELLRHINTPNVLSCSLFQSEIENAFTLLLRAVNSSFIRSPVPLTGLLLYIFSMISQSPGVNTDSSDLNDDRIMRTVHYIDRNFPHKITITCLAGIAGLNKSYYIRLFHTVMGCPPADYIIKKRLSRAADLLLFSSATIRDIAQESGFSHYNHFSDKFKQNYGARPKHYRTTMLPGSFSAAGGSRSG
ncbi:MAG: AraC family transcriptional regulator [Spirochaetota bacterium]